MSKLFFLGVLLTGLGLCIGCGEPTAAPESDASLDSPAYEQQMTEGTEAPMEAVEETEVDVTEEAAAETAPAEEAAAAPEAPAAEEATPAATDAP